MASSSWKDKLDPRRFPHMSPLMTAFVGLITERRYSSPAIVDLVETSDGHLLAQVEGDIGYNVHIGPYYEALLDNWGNLLLHAGLTEREKTAAWKAFWLHMPVRRTRRESMEADHPTESLEAWSQRVDALIEETRRLHQGQ
jgi:hypothetical protein